MTLRRLLPAAVLAVVLTVPSTAGAQARTICHATGDPAVPYQQIDTTPAEVLDHLQHADDLVPAPAGGCPVQAVPDDPEPATDYALPDVVPGPAARPQRRRRPRRAVAPAPAAGPQAAVAPAAAAGNLRATADIRGDTLPLTGGEVPMVAIAGLGFLLAGAGLRLRLAGQAL